MNPDDIRQREADAKGLAKLQKRCEAQAADIRELREQVAELEGANAALMFSVRCLTATQESPQ